MTTALDQATAWMARRPSPGIGEEDRGAEPGFNVVGHIGHEYGLGIAARTTIQTLRSEGERVRVVDIAPAWSGQPTRNLENAPTGPGINIFHLNPPDLLTLVYSRPHWLDLENNLNVCVPFWELPRFPRFWLFTLSAMDAVLAPSRFIYSALAKDMTSSGLIYFPQAVRLPPEVLPDRARWRIPGEALVILCVFDLKADIARKNPFAAVDAYRRAFPTGEKTRLMVKVNTTGVRAERRLLEELRRSTGQRPDIVLLEDQLQYKELLSLVASCDILLSLHRAEGLGLVLIEAMSLGKVVVATGWSGNMDFMTSKNACLVPYHLTPVRSTTRQYSSAYVGRFVKWAEPETDAAADWLRRISNDPALKGQIGGQAMEDMKRLRTRVDRAFFVPDLWNRYWSMRGATRKETSAASLRMVRLSSLRSTYALYSALAFVSRRFSQLRRPAGQSG